MANKRLICSLLGGLLAACSDQQPATIANPAAPSAKPALVQQVQVQLDIEVGPQGKVLSTRLASGQADNLFAKIAMQQVKQQQFPLRTEQQKPVSYWLLNQTVTVGSAQTLADGN